MSYTQLVANSMFEILKEGIVVRFNRSGKSDRAEVSVPLVFGHIVVPIRVIDGTGKGLHI